MILNKLKHDNYEPVYVNILLSLAYEIEAEPLLSLKYRSLAFVERLRHMGQMAGPGNISESRPSAIPPPNRASILSTEGG